jgi:biopolymer transport protein ExbB/TolQ
MNFITDALYWLSTGLLVPVIILLLFLFVKALLLAGGFFGMFMQRKREEKKLQTHIDQLTYQELDAFYPILPRQQASLFAIYARKLIDSAKSPAHCNRNLSMFELDADKDLAASKTLAKMGPVLGLMGTLIPMGPALVGLSTGDIASMAYNMQVAFATTVVGLAAGAIGFITLQIKQRWYLKDMANLEFIHKLMEESRPSAINPNGVAKESEARINLSHSEA